MQRKVVALIAVVGFLAVGGGFVGLRWAARQPPDFYQAALADRPAPAVREEAAREFAQQTAHLVDELRYSAHWEEEFSQTQANAWLAEELPQRYGRRIPRGVSDPRVQFEDGLVRLGFQLTQKRFQGIVSLALRPTVTAPNRVSIAVESLSAGLLPLSPGAFVADVSKHLNRYDVRHEWRIENGLHVLDVTVTPNRGDRPVLEAIEVREERVRVAGHRESPAAITMRGDEAVRRM